MRLIGKITDNNEAELALGLFASRKIECRLEQTSNGWELWALNEDQRLEAETLYLQFVNDPDKSQYEPLAAEARKALIETAARQIAAEKAARRERSNWEAIRNFATRPTPLSWAVIGICVALWLLQTLSPNLLLPWLRNALQIAPLGDNSLDAIMSGEIWRLFSPALLHAPVIVPGGEVQMFNIMHILFNILWMKDLAPLIEKRHGSWYLLALLLVIAGGSNLLQFALAGPNFLGLSGVVYGLLGFLWLRGKTDPQYGIQLNPGIVMFMLIWLVLCFFMGGVANGCHIAGLVLGGAWGAFSGLNARYSR